MAFRDLCIKNGISPEIGYLNKPEQAIELHSNPKKKIIKMSENDLGQNRIKKIKSGQMVI